MKTLKLILGLSAAVLLSTVAMAETVGTLTMESGMIKLRRNRMDTLYMDPGLQLPVENGDEIQTGLKTRAIIRMAAQPDTVELFSSTFFTVKAVTAEKTELLMPAGKARFQVERPQKPLRKKRRRFRLRTANAVIGVKGTRFVVGVLNGNTNVLTLSGIVSLSSIAVPDVEVVVRPNQASKIQANQQPTAPVTVAPDLQERIISSESAESFEQIDYGTVNEVNEVGQRQPAEAGEAIEDVDKLIEVVNEEVDQIQEDLSDTQINRRSIEFEIVDE